MKWFFFSSIILHMQIACAQTRTDSIRKVVKSLSKGINATQLRNEEISAFAGSINKYTGGRLPNFLFDICLDWQAAYWPDLHAATSVRWMILEKVNNKISLKLILKTRYKRLKLHCNHVSDNFYPYLAIPMIKKSFYKLIRKRYRQL